MIDIRFGIQNRSQQHFEKSSGRLFSSRSVGRASVISLLAVIELAACRDDVLAPRRQPGTLRDGVTRAESLALKAPTRPSRSLRLVDETCVIQHSNPGAILGCTMAVPQVAPSNPWLQHSGGIYEPPQTAPISIKFPGAVHGVSLQSTGALKCSGSSLGRLIGYRNGAQVDTARNRLTDPSDCGSDDVTFGVTGGLSPSTVVDSLVIQGVNPWTFLVFGSTGRARLDYTITFVP